MYKNAVLIFVETGSRVGPLIVVAVRARSVVLKSCKASQAVAAPLRFGGLAGVAYTAMFKMLHSNTFGTNLVKVVSLLASSLGQLYSDARSRLPGSFGGQLLLVNGSPRD